MSGIRASNTRPEILLRRGLHARGLRYRVNVRRLPGTPDLVLRKWKCVIQVHGCYWHRHPGCSKATMPSSNVAFWSKKFETNVRRDRTTLEKLHEMGWRTVVVWECAIGSTVGDEILETIEAFLSSETQLHLEIG